MLKKKKILLIGGNGFLGQAILNQFNLKKYNISILDPSLNKKSLDNNNIQFYFKFSTLDKKAILKALNKVKNGILLFI